MSIFFGFPHAFSNIERPSQMTPIAACPGVNGVLGEWGKWSVGRERESGVHGV